MVSDLSYTPFISRAVCSVTFSASWSWPSRMLVSRMLVRAMAEALRVMGMASAARVVRMVLESSGSSLLLGRERT